MKRCLPARAVCALLFFVAALLAQDYRGRVQGIVTDSTQATVLNATVTLVNINTAVRTVRQTNEAGIYRFDYVDPGSYTITVEMPGFSRFVQENVLVQSGAVARRHHRERRVESRRSPGEHHGRGEPGGCAV